MKRKLLLLLTCFFSWGVEGEVAPRPSLEEAARALTREEYGLATRQAPVELNTEEDRQRAFIAAMAYFVQQQYSEAARLYEQLAAKTSAPFGSAEALYYAAEARFRNLEREESRQLFEKFLGLYPTHRLRLRIEGRLADLAFSLGENEAALSGYQRLVTQQESFFDPSQMLFSLAILWQESGDSTQALTALLEVWRKYPTSPAAKEAEIQLTQNYPARWRAISAQERLQRANALFEAMSYAEACSVAKQIEGALPEDPSLLSLEGKCALQEKNHLLAGELLIKAAGEDPALLLKGISAYTSASGEMRSAGYEAARREIKALLAKFPQSKEAQKAQYKAAWLDYHQEKYQLAIAGFDRYLKRFPADADAQWYSAWSCYLHHDLAGAKERLQALSKNTGMLQGGKGNYWLGRVHEKLGELPEASVRYRAAIKEWPFSYYAMLSRNRLTAMGESSTAFEDEGRQGANIYQDEPLQKEVPILESEGLLAEARFWLSVGYQAEAKEALDRVTEGLQSAYPSTANLWLCSLYQAAGEYKRPLELSWEKDVLKKRPLGEVARWWSCGYPRAHEVFVVAAAQKEEVSPYLLWSLMRQESAYSPYLVSRADAVGLLQLLPKTASKIASALGTPNFFLADLFRPKENLRLASAYVERLLRRFGGHLWLAAAAYNGGPGAVDRWLSADGTRPFDEFVEQISYAESREYLKKVSGHYARYLYLYEGKEYQLETAFSPKNDATIVDF
jgi:soluble lytic murein transglycosylase